MATRVETNDAMLRWVATRSAALAAVATAGSLAFREPAITLGVAIGAAVALANFWALRRLVTRLVTGAGATRTRAGGLLTLKFGFLAGGLYLLVRYVPMHVPALLAGLSVVVLVILAGSLAGPPLDAATNEQEERVR